MLHGGGSRSTSAPASQQEAGQLAIACMAPSSAAQVMCCYTPSLMPSLERCACRISVGGVDIPVVFSIYKESTFVAVCPANPALVCQCKCYLLAYNDLSLSYGVFQGCSGACENYRACPDVCSDLFGPGHFLCLFWRPARKFLSGWQASGPKRPGSSAIHGYYGGVVEGRLALAFMFICCCSRYAAAGHRQDAAVRKQQCSLESLCQDLSVRGVLFGARVSHCLTCAHMQVKCSLTQTRSGRGPVQTFF
jgi:hypothetical protein